MWSSRVAANGTYYVFEHGVSRGVFGAYAAGHRFQVAVEGGVVRYLRNGAVFYTSGAAPAYPRLVDTALYIELGFGAFAISTRYPMLAPQSVEHLPCWLRASGFHVSQRSLKALDGLHAIEKLLVGFRVLDDDLGLSVDRPDQRMTGHLTNCGLNACGSKLPPAHASIALRRATAVQDRLRCIIPTASDKLRLTP